MGKTIYYYKSHEINSLKQFLEKEQIEHQIIICFFYNNIYSYMIKLTWIYNIEKPFITDIPSQHNTTNEEFQDYLSESRKYEEIISKSYSYDEMIKHLKDESIKDNTKKIALGLANKTNSLLKYNDEKIYTQYLYENLYTKGFLQLHTINPIRKDLEKKGILKKIEFGFMGNAAFFQDYVTIIWQNKNTHPKIFYNLNDEDIILQNRKELKIHFTHIQNMMEISFDYNKVLEYLRKEGFTDKTGPMKYIRDLFS